MIKFTCILLLCLLGLTFADDFNLYISPFGNDTNDGSSQDDAILTVKQALLLVQNATDSGDISSDDLVYLYFNPGVYSGADNLGQTLVNNTFIIKYVEPNEDTNSTVNEVYFTGDGAQTGFIANTVVEIDGSDSDSDNLIYFQNVSVAVSIAANAANNTIYITNVVFGNGTKSGVATEVSIDNLEIGLKYSQFASVQNPLTVTATGDSKIDLESVTFEQSGRIVLNEVATVKITDVTVNNAASGFLQATVTTSNNTIFDIENFNSNVTSSDDNGSVFNIVANGGQFNVEDSTFTSGNSKKSGGAIYLQNIEALIGAEDDSDSDSVVFTSNTATNGGGAYAHNGLDSFVGSATFNGNSAAYGAAIEISSNTTSLSLGNVLFENNNVTDTTYGVIDCCKNETLCSTGAVNTTDDVVFQNSNAPNVTCGVVQEETFSAPPADTDSGVSSVESDDGFGWWAWLILALIVAAVIVIILAAVGFFLYKKRQQGAYVTVE